MTLITPEQAKEWMPHLKTAVTFGLAGLTFTCAVFVYLLATHQAFHLMPDTLECKYIELNGFVMCGPHDWYISNDSFNASDLAPTGLYNFSHPLADWD